MRTIVELPSEQIDALDVLCRREKISRAEAVRRAVAQHLRANQHANASRAFGLWRARAEDGLPYQERLRREWDDRPRD